ncbi:MAG: hypothetical protein LBO72_02990 [Helicobacteraceae bacterium]|nr:hypothetical protein [Helicobacteraceae bacterium]
MAVFAFGDDEQIKRFIADEENLTGVALWEDNAAIEKRFDVKFKRYCDPAKDGDCDHHKSLEACVEAEGYYVIFNSPFQANFETADGVSFQAWKPAMPCVKKQIRDMQTTMIGKSKREIIALFEKPNEHINNSNLIHSYISNYWDEWNERYKINITRWDAVSFMFKNDRVVAYDIFKGGEPSPDSYIKKDK